MKHMLITCWACLALIPALFAQSGSTEKTEVFQDTLVIGIERSVQVRILCPSLRELRSYNRGDSLKQVFIQDLKQASLAEWPKEIHYLVGENGKRRMKLKTDVYAEQEFDLKSESYRLQENLPAYHFIIYDLTRSVQLHLFLENSSDLKLIEELNIGNALAQMALLKKEVKHSCRLEMKRQLDGFVKTGNSRLRYDQLEISPDIRFALVGNQPTPVLGGDITLHLSDKYGVPSIRTGVNFLTYTFGDFSKGDFSQLYYKHALNLSFAYNMNHSRNNPYWFGLEGGPVFQPIPTLSPKAPSSTGDVIGYNLNVIAGFRNYSVSFGSIRDANFRNIPMVTLHLPF